MLLKPVILQRIKQSMCFGFLSCLLSAILIATPVVAQKTTMSDIRKDLQSPEIEGLYQRTYYSLLDRIDADGFLQESLTGRYPGMFPRTVGGAVSLFLETGELEIAEKIINCTLESMTVNDMERIPHVFLRQTNSLLPVFNKQEHLQPNTTVELYKLSCGCGAALKFKAPGKPIVAVEAAVKLGACKGTLTMTLRKDKESKPLKSVSIHTDDVLPGQIWHRFKFKERLELVQDQEYFIRLDFSGFGYPVWYGLDEISEKEAGAFWLDGTANPLNWIYHEKHAPAYAIDIGHLRHEQQSEPYKIYCDWDQIDGQAHVIMAWARLALKREITAFEKQTYSIVAKLMDRTSDQPYFMWGRGHEIGVNLVQNVSLEHSREGRYWHAWDLLTQCVVGASLESMVEIAKRNGDSYHALRWQDRLQVLKKGIEENLTRILNGKKVYLEMRLPDGAGGVPFTGMSWINFAPVMAQWEPLERVILQNTVEALRHKLLLSFKGYKYLAMEYDPDGKVNHEWVIGKGVGWEIDYSRQEKEYSRIKEWFNFLRAFHSGDLYTESMYIDTNGEWITGDGGNGEQSSWWCWAMARLRKEAGLPAVPKNMK